MCVQDRWAQRAGSAGSRLGGLTAVTSCVVGVATTRREWSEWRSATAGSPGVVRSRASCARASSISTPVSRRLATASSTPHPTRSIPFTTPSRTGIAPFNSSTPFIHCQVSSSLYARRALCGGYHYDATTIVRHPHAARLCTAFIHCDCVAYDK